jgi:hypothetical protein
MPRKKGASPNETESAAESLAALGADQLAALLVELAQSNPDVARRITRLTSSESQNVRRFKSALSALKRRKRFVSYAESSTYAKRLRDILSDLEAPTTDPATGAALVAEFIRCDSAALDACDDSNGSIGGVFRIDATEIFVRFAAQSPDKNVIADLLLDLIRQDDYGVRYRLLESASQFLPKEKLRQLADQLWMAGVSARASEDTHDPESARSFLRPGNREFRLVDELARQLNDPDLFERASRESDPPLGVAARTEIAQVWLSAGKPRTALEWIESIDPSQTFWARERDDVLRAIHEKLGNRDEVERLAWKRFREGRSAAGLEELLRVIGEQHRDDIVTSEAERILSEPGFRAGEAAYLIDCDLLALAAKYVVDRRQEIDGHDWSRLVPLAKALQRTGEHLAATIVFRALLDATLERGYSPAYSHAAKHLRHLDQLEAAVIDWGDIPPHDAYTSALRASHGRKSSSWAHYRKDT